MKILGIETSCDDTCFAIYDCKNDSVISNYEYNNFSAHAIYKGIVPEIAARIHILSIEKIIKKIFLKTNLNFHDIDAIAYTAGPGLAGSLFVGATFAVSLAYLLDLPIIKIHHMEAHLFSPFIENTINIPCRNFLGLLISGGHTQLIKVKKLGHYKILGTTMDDSIGNVFDKVANLLNLGFLGGSKISKFSSKGNIGRFKFPRPMIYHTGFNFSFSGLRTCVVRHILKYKNDLQALYDIAIEFESAIFDSVILKCIKALKSTGYNTLVIAGGVSSNVFFRKRISLIMNKKINIFFPKYKYCSDNAVMIAYMGFLRFKVNKCLDIYVKPKWSIEELKKFKFILNK